MQNQKKEKILAIQFQYLGDTIFLTPALQIIKLNFPKAELHVLVPNEIIPILKSVNYIDKIWGTPRSRGKLNILDQLPVVLNLRKEKFDRIVDQFQFTDDILRVFLRHIRNHITRLLRCFQILATDVHMVFCKHIINLCQNSRHVVVNMQQTVRIF